jgi:23S rRNA (uracil1939-C5)-methyltransferase
MSEANRRGRSARGARFAKRSRGGLHEAPPKLLPPGRTTVGAGGRECEAGGRECWDVEKLVPGGDGMARLPDGRIGFVSGGLPGDVILPTEVLTKKGYVRADAWSLVRPSEQRVAPACPIAERCGGCDWMALERRAQLEQKAAILKEALRRTGGFATLPPAISVVAAGPALGYRARVRFHVDADGTIGFFARRSHDLVEIDRCPVCRPEIDRALSLLRTLDRSVLRAFSSVEIRSTLEGSGAMLELELRPGFAVSEAARKALAGLSGDVTVSVAGQGGASSEQVLTLLGGVRVGAGPGVFTQVNPDVNALLVSEVVAGSRERRVERFCDLFAGVGNFALPLLAAGMSGVAVELDARAVESARRAAREAGLPADVFVAEDAARFLAGLGRREPPFDLVILDPPRRGAKDVLELVVRAAPRHIAMCSCDPVTLARDLATLVRSGFELDSVRGFDMFPQTHHIEALAWMERKTT